MLRTRFAPSPTGRLHLGNARTALFNALYAHRAGGAFVLRVENTDAARSRDSHAGAMIEILRWLGLAWEEGPDVGGAFAPYRQSERGAVYAAHYDRLLAAGHAYPCFCTAETLAAARERARSEGRPPRYPGTCARLAPREAERRLATGETASLRLRVPANRRLAYRDLVRGGQAMASDEIGDFVIRRADGTPAFLFANALDDALMGITHVLRGEDHLSNTPRQLLLLDALELASPIYGHLPLVVDAAGKPLSKREGGADLAELRAAGILPEALRNYLLRLGHATERSDLLDASDLEAAFDPARLGRAPARYDPVQLGHWQRLAIAALDHRRAAEWSGAELSGPVAWDAFWPLVRDNVATRDDVHAWAEALGSRPTLDQRATEALAGTPGEFLAAGREMSREGDFAVALEAMRKRTGLQGGRLLRPLRAALTGRVDGPELARIWAYLTPEQRRARFDRPQFGAGKEAARVPS